MSRACPHSRGWPGSSRCVRERAGGPPGFPRLPRPSGGTAAGEHCARKVGAVNRRPPWLRWQLATLATLGALIALQKLVVDGAGCGGQAARRARSNEPGREPVGATLATEARSSDPLVPDAGAERSAADRSSGRRARLPSATPLPTPSMPPQREMEALDEASQQVFWKRSVELLDQMLGAQPKDRVWTSVVSGAAESALQQGRYTGTVLAGVDCRASLCKMSLAHADTNFRRAFWRTDFIAQKPWAGQLLAAPTELADGRLGSHVFFTRGRDLQPLRQVTERVRVEVAARFGNRSVAQKADPSPAAGGSAAGARGGR